MLILDEPANGLDPAGIRWMRDLLREYADGGATVLLSSHLLHEIEVIADDLMVIGNGRIVAQGTQAELLASAGTLVRTPEVALLSAALAVAGIDYHEGDSREGNGTLRVEADPAIVGQLALEAGAALALRAAEGVGLEEMFLQLTADTQRDHHAPRTRSRTHTRSSLMTAIAPRIPPVAQGPASLGAVVATGPSATVAPRPHLK